MIPIARVALTACVVAMSCLAPAWNDFGHMVVASVAERQLTFEAKQKILKLVTVGATPQTSELLTAACWADDTRNKDNGPWHYINYFFRSDGKPVNLGPAEQNVVWAIQKFSKELKSGATSELQKANALRYLLHYVGDIHQPLHCVARATDAFPQGDRGGNDFRVVSPAGWDPAPRSLHFFWDMGGGIFSPVERPLNAKSRDLVTETAELAIKLNPDSKMLKEIGVEDPFAWAKEGLALAKSFVYTTQEGAEPNKAYIERTRQISLRQVALAGYRLGRLLNELLEK